MRNFIVITLLFSTALFATAFDSDLAPSNFAATDMNTVVNPSNYTDDPSDPITWTALTNSPAVGRYWCPGSGVVRDTIWFCGGRTSAAASIADIIAYVPAGDAWVTSGLPVLLTARRAGGGGRIGNKIYVACGRNASSVTLNTCEEFDVDTKVVTTKANAPGACWACCGAVAAGKLYIVGSENTGTNCYEYDPATNTWATKAPIPVGRGWATAAGTSTKLYVFGGSGLSDCYEFDPVANAWTAKASMPGIRVYATAIAVNDADIYVVGGSTSAIGDNIVYKYNIASNTWTTETPMLTPKGWEMVNQVGNNIYVSFGSDCSTPTYLQTNQRGSVAPPPANDVGVDAIHYPTGVHSPNVAMIPKARVKNYGTAAQPTFSVVCSIMSGTTVRYTDTKTAPAMAVGDTALITFASWTPTISENVTVIVRTLLGGDQNPDNDRMSRVTLIANFLVYEGFNDAAFPPTGWQAVIGSGTYNWERFTAGTNPTCTPYEGAGMTGYRSYSATSGLWARLISAPFTLTAATPCTLKFHMTLSTGYTSSHDSIYVETSTNGTAFNTIAGFDRVGTAFAWVEQAVFLGILPVGTNYIAFRSVSKFGDNMYMDWVRVTAAPTGIEENPNTNINLSTLNVVKPNPVRGIAHISFNIAKSSNANLKIYDASGKLVKTLVNSTLESGTYNLTWNGTDDNNRAVSEGIYFYTLESNNHSSTKKLVLTR